MGIDEIITAAGGFAILIGAVAWLIRSIINHLLSKDLDNFKLILQQNYQEEILRLKSTLQLVEFEHQVRYSRLHEKRATIIAELYSKLIEVQKITSNYIQDYPSLTENKKKDRVYQFREYAKQFRDYFDKNRIYFNQETCIKIDIFNESISNAFSRLPVSIPNDMESKISSSQIMVEWKKSVVNLEADIPEIKASLEESFREILGVPHPEAKRKT